MLPHIHTDPKKFRASIRSSAILVAILIVALVLVLLAKGGFVPNVASGPAHVPTEAEKLEVLRSLNGSAQSGLTADEQSAQIDAKAQVLRQVSSSDASNSNNSPQQISAKLNVLNSLHH